MRIDLERLEDILEAIDKIEKYIDRGKDIFNKNELIQVWMIHHLQIIGEASAAMSHKSIEANPKIALVRYVRFSQCFSPRVFSSRFRNNLDCGYQ